MIAHAITLTYDGSYEGLLSCIFESYRLRVIVDTIVPKAVHQEGLFGQSIYVETRANWAERVERGVIKQTGKKGAKLLFRCFLSEQEKVEMLIYHFVQSAMQSTENVLENYSDDKILALHQINKKIGREVHRMHAFVRFQQTKDGIYTSLIDPDFNVLPLIGDHFEKRYPAQEWLIYDTRRHYGIFYDKENMNFITFKEEDHQQLRYLSKDVLTTEEDAYQILWKSYFESVNIPERVNMKLHLQHVPKRYWKYLVEKQ